MPKHAAIDVELARRLYDAGRSWDEIGDACGVTAFFLIVAITACDFWEKTKNR